MMAAGSSASKSTLSPLSEASRLAPCMHQALATQAVPLACSVPVQPVSLPPVHAALCSHRHVALGCSSSRRMRRLQRILCASRYTAGQAMEHRGWLHEIAVLKAQEEQLRTVCGLLLGQVLWLQQATSYPRKWVCAQHQQASQSQVASPLPIGAVSSCWLTHSRCMCVCCCRRCSFR
jgi:hypothetical protein